jgi:hypothetical protein
MSERPAAPGEPARAIALRCYVDGRADSIRHPETSAERRMEDRMSPQAAKGRRPVNPGRPINPSVAPSVAEASPVREDAYRQGLEVKRRLFGAGKERPVSHGNLADDLLRLSDELVFGRVYTSRRGAC